MTAAEATMSREERSKGSNESVLSTQRNYR
jgi:hypothetical protein